MNNGDLIRELIKGYEEQYFHDANFHAAIHLFTNTIRSTVRGMSEDCAEWIPGYAKEFWHHG